MCAHLVVRHTCNVLRKVKWRGGEFLRVLTRDHCIAAICSALICFSIVGCAKGALSSTTPGPTPTPSTSPTPTPTPTGSPTPTPTPSGHSVALSWTPSSSSGVVGYNVYRSSSSAGPFTKVGNATATSFTDVSVQAGQTYFYTVTAVSNANVESTESTLVSATVP